MSLTVGSKDLSEQSLPPLATKKPREPSYNGWYAAQFLNSASASTIDPFLPIFARKIGATSIEIGILSGIFSLINISQIIWAKVAAKGENRLIAFLGKIISGLLFIPMAFLKTGQIVILLILRFLQGLFTSAAAPTETSLMASHIPQRDRTKRMQTFTRLALIGGLLGTLFAGFAFTYLNSELKVSDEVAFTVIFILTGLLGILTAFVFLASVPEYRGLPEPDPSSIIYHSVSSSPSRTSLFAKIQLYLRHFSNFWWFCVFAMVFYFGVYLASPFFIILEIEEYGFSFAEAAILTSISTACQILFIA
ncbi:MAG: MFS transporter, partial [Candidatus Hodarchaeota archaeon]